MSYENKVFQYDEGTKLEFDLGINVGLISVARLNMIKPDKTKVEFDCELDTINNVVYYTTQENDLNLAGTYQLQIYCEVDNGSWKGRGKIIKLPVEKVI